MRAMKMFLAAALLVLLSRDADPALLRDAGDAPPAAAPDLGAAEGAPLAVEMSGDEPPLPLVEAETELPLASVPEADAPRPLFERYVVQVEIHPPEPAPLEVIAEDRIGAGPVVRFHTRGSRVEESEGYRAELRGLSPGREWPSYVAAIEGMGFAFVDAAMGPLDRPRFALERNGLRFVLEVALDGHGRVARIDVGPNL